MDKIIQVSGLKKAYGTVEAVRGIDFYVERGKRFAFLGPNGAGKSTTIDMICTFLKPDEGEILIDGYRAGESDGKIRSRIGVVFQEGLLDNLLSVRENLYVRGSLYGLRGARLKQAVERSEEITGLGDIAKRPYGKLSGGQKRRADIAKALVNMPKILFLDEPTTGLDPQTRKNIWDTIVEMQKENGMTVFYTTHYMEEAAGADFIIIIDDGKIAAKGTPLYLKETYSKDSLILDIANEEKLVPFLDAHLPGYSRNGGRITVKLDSTMDAIPLIEQCKAYISGFEVHNGTMDDVFLNITGKEIRK